MYLSINLWSTYRKGYIHQLHIYAEIIGEKKLTIYTGTNYLNSHVGILKDLDLLHPMIQKKRQFMNLGNILKQIGYNQLHLISKPSNNSYYNLSKSQMQSIHKRLRQEIKGLDILTQERIKEIEEIEKEEFYAKWVGPLRSERVFKFKPKIVGSH